MLRQEIRGRQRPAGVPRKQRGEGKMNEVKVTKVGDTLMITGADKAAVELAAAELAAKGARILSQAEPMGSKWIVTCKDPSRPPVGVRSEQARHAAHDQRSHRAGGDDQGP